MNDLKKNFPEDLKTVVEDWKSGNYIPKKIQDIYDIFKNVNHGKTFFIKYAEQQPKGDLKFGLSLLTIPLFFTAWVYIYCFVIYITVSSYYLFLIVLPWIWGIPCPTAFFRLLCNRRQEIMKKHGYITINPRGVLYRYSHKKFGYFTWSSIVSIKEGENINYKHYGKYIHYQLKPQKLTAEKRKYTHLIRYDNIDTTEIASIKFFYELVNRYWKKYRDFSPPNSKIPTPYVSDDLMFIIMMIGFSFIPIDFILLLFLI